MPHPLFKVTKDQGVAAGELRHPVVLAKRPAATDEGGGATKYPYTAVKTVWAAIMPLNSSEVVRAAQEGIEISHRILIRYDPDIAQYMPFDVGDWRIEYGTRKFAIKGCVNVNERNRILDLSAFERKEVD